MRRWSIALLHVVLFVALLPRPVLASDMDWWRWWDSLSGPGPFNGLGYDQPLVNFTLKAPSPQPHIFDPTGFDKDPTRLHVKAGVEFAFLFAQHNHLPYAPPRDQNPPGIRAYPVMGTIDFGRKGVEVGAGIGAVLFAGDGFRFGRTLISPRATFKPLMWFKTHPSRRDEILQIRIGAAGIMGKMTAKDFGAIGPFEGGNEWLKTTTVSVNLMALLR